MNRVLVASLLAVSAATPAIARNTPVHVTLESVLGLPDAKEQLDGSVKFYLAGAPTPLGERQGQETAAGKTHAFSSPEDACRAAALSVLVQFAERAKHNGANAVVDMVSYNRHVTFSSPIDVECMDGVLAGGLVLKGTLVKIGQ